MCSCPFSDACELLLSSPISVVVFFVFFLRNYSHHMWFPVSKWWHDISPNNYEEWTQIFFFPQGTRSHFQYCAGQLQLKDQKSRSSFQQCESRVFHSGSLWFSSSSRAPEEAECCSHKHYVEFYSRLADNLHLLFSLVLCGALYSLINTDPKSECAWLFVSGWPRDGLATCLWCPLSS